MTAALSRLKMIRPKGKNRLPWDTRQAKRKAMAAIRQMKPRVRQQDIRGQKNC